MSVAVPPGLIGVGAARYANISSSVALSGTPSAGDTLPTSAKYALINVKTQGAHFSFDGGAATTDDLFVPAGETFWLDNARTLLVNMRMIEAAATAVVSIAYFDGPQG